MENQANHKTNILVVDDEQEHAQVMCEALQRLGHRCDVAYNFAEAKSRLGQRSYGVVVTDLMMDGRCDAGGGEIDAPEAESGAPGAAGGSGRF